MKKINILLTINSFLILIILILLFTVPFTNKKNNNNILNKEIKNEFEVKIFVAEEKGKKQPFIVREDTKRYVEKIWEHHDKVQEARERAFFR